MEIIVKPVSTQVRLAHLEQFADGAKLEEATGHLQIVLVVAGFALLTTISCYQEYIKYQDIRHRLCVNSIYERCLMHSALLKAQLPHPNFTRSTMNNVV